MKRYKSWLVTLALVVSVVAIAKAADYYQRFLKDGSEIYSLLDDGSVTQAKGLTITSGGLTVTSGNESIAAGSIKLGSAIPTTSVAYSMKIPFYVSTGTISNGDIVIASGTSYGVGWTGVAYGYTGLLTATTTVLGICDGTYTIGQTGMMSVGGYALVHTSGVVNVGDLIVTTITAVGYGGALAPGTSVLVGSVVGKAVALGTATGGLTPVRLGW